MPIAPVAPALATLAEKLARPPPSSDVVGGEGADLAGGPIDADARAHLERMPFDARLELLVAIVGKADRAAGKDMAASAT